MIYYRNIKPPIRYSYFVKSPPDRQLEITYRMGRNFGFLVDIIAYCFMPNHLHLLLRQFVEGGISIYMNRLSNSYARYFNTRHERAGPIFQGRFKSVLIENDKQLLQVSRYIHLNPYSSKIIRSINDLQNYEYSSLPEYLSLMNIDMCNKGLIMSHYRNVKGYQNFVFDHADYQKKLEKTKHLLLE